MRNTIKILIVALLLLSLSSCFNTKQDNEVNEAKKQMGIIEQENNTEKTDNNLPNNPIDEIKNEGVTLEGNGKIEDIKNYEIINVTDVPFLKFDSLDGVNLLSGEVEISGTTLTEVDEITVEFKNETSDFPDDKYKLQKFKSGDKSFVYRAFSNYETLDFGINEYTFTSKSEDTISITKVILKVQKEEEKEEKTQKSSNAFLGDIDFDVLPIGENFGEPKQIGNGNITYSDIKGLEIEKKEPHSFDCSKNTTTDNYYVSEILDESIPSYYWWNTCRPFGEKEGISFFVLKLDGNKYIYEKHIYLNNGIYGIYELESGEDFVGEEDDSASKIAKLQEKNDELKGKNDDFTIIEIIIDLFEKILTNLKK